MRGRETTRASAGSVSQHQRGISPTRAKGSLRRSLATAGERSIARVVDKLVVELESKLGSSNVTLELDDTARTWIAERGYDAKMGARPMARIIPMTMRLLRV